MIPGSTRLPSRSTSADRAGFRTRSCAGCCLDLLDAAGHQEPSVVHRERRCPRAVGVGGEPLGVAVDGGDGCCVLRCWALRCWALRCWALRCWALRCWALRLWGHVRILPHRCCGDHPSTGPFPPSGPRGRAAKSPGCSGGSDPPDGDPAQPDDDEHHRPAEHDLRHPEGEHLPRQVERCHDRGSDHEGRCPDPARPAVGTHEVGIAAPAGSLADRRTDDHSEQGPAGQYRRRPDQSRTPRWRAGSAGSSPRPDPCAPRQQRRWRRPRARPARAGATRGAPSGRLPRRQRPSAPGPERPPATHRPRRRPPRT